MAVNKDIPPSALGEGQREPQDLFSAMNQGSVPTKKVTTGLAGAMKQGASKSNYKLASLSSRMKQGGG